MFICRVIAFCVPSHHCQTQMAYNNNVDIIIILILDNSNTKINNKINNNSNNDTIINK